MGPGKASLPFETDENRSHDGDLDVSWDSMGVELRAYDPSVYAEVRAVTKRILAKLRSQHRAARRTGN